MSVTPGPGQATPAGPEMQEEERRASVDELSSNVSDTVPSTTRLKYSRLKGDGSQDVDDWLTEFKSTAIANQEEPATILRIFQGLLKGEAFKWYQDVPERFRTNWEQLSSLFLRTFREAGGEARALGRLSKMMMGKSESIRRYGQRVKALIQKLTTEISSIVQVEWYVAGFPEKMGFQIRQARPTTLKEAMAAAQIRSSQVVVQQRFPVGVCWNCGDPSHYTSACLLRPGQGAPLTFPCQNCGEQGYDLPRCPKPLQVRPVYKQVEIPPHDQTGLNYGSTAGVENPGK